MTYIELLSPARNLECGIAAIDHGADAVYIGAMRYGARAAAGNSIEDIAEMCRYAHQFSAKVYVTVNTILYDDELEDTRKLIWKLYEIGVDALIVQDFSLLKMDLPPIPLHASTQMDNRSIEKAKMLESLGFQQIVLARELSLSEIRDIHDAVPNTPLEAFVHGALCVSYSGKCYASQFCFGRSANRGECAQFCRLPFTLIDSDGEVVCKDKYLLSLHDMNRSSHLEEMMDAGVRSFKIEGRLKDVSYVKNITAYYRRAIDQVIQRRTEYARSSSGDTSFYFTPNPDKSFSRGFIDYFLKGRTFGLASFDTPKSRGEKVGYVKGVQKRCIVVSGTAVFSNGDGLSFIDENGKLQGFRVNRVEGNHLYTTEQVNVRKGDILWRNLDHTHEKTMAQKTAERSIPISITLSDTEQGFHLSFHDDKGKEVGKHFLLEHQLAKSDQTDSIKDVLSKLGGTVLSCRQVNIRFTNPWFIPRSVLAEWRRSVAEEYSTYYVCSTSTADKQNQHCVFNEPACSFQHNISNRLSRQFYEESGAKVEEMAMEVTGAKADHMPLMTCRYCLRHEMGWCQRNRKNKCEFHEPFFLLDPYGRRFLLDFDCKKCEMRVLNA